MIIIIIYFVMVNKKNSHKIITMQQIFIKVIKNYIFKKLLKKTRKGTWLRLMHRRLLFYVYIYIYLFIYL